MATPQAIPTDEELAQAPPQATGIPTDEELAQPPQDLSGVPTDEELAAKPAPLPQKTWRDSFNELATKVGRGIGDVASVAKTTGSILTDMSFKAAEAPFKLVGKGVDALAQYADEATALHPDQQGGFGISKLPNLTEKVKQATSVLPTDTTPEQKGGFGVSSLHTLEGAGLGVLSTVDGMLTPAGLTTMGALMAAPEGIMPIVSGYFAKQMASGAWDKWPAMKQAAEDGDWPAFARAAAQSGTEGLMALSAARHAVASTVAWAPEKGTAEPFDLAKHEAKIQKNFDQKADLVAKATNTDPEAVSGPNVEVGSRFEPTMAEREQVRRLSEANGGVISSDQVPDSVLTKIQQLKWLQGGKGGWNDPDTIDRTMKYFFDQGVTKEDLQSVIAHGFANDLTPAQAKIWNFALDKVAPQQQRLGMRLGSTAADIQDYLTNNAFGTRVITPRERVMALGRKTLTPLDPSDLPDLPEAGKSRVGAVGLNGEPVDRLMPPDQNVQSTLSAHLSTIFGADPQGIAQGLAGLYGVKEPVHLAVDEEAEDTPSTVQNSDGSWTVTLPPDATPYEVAHEIAMHVAGWDDQDFPHDNNKIAAQVISDLEANGLTRFYDNRQPKWGTAPAEGTQNPAGDAATWNLSKPEGDTRSEIPYMRHVYDPHGQLSPANIIRDYPLGKEVSNLLMMAPDAETARGALGLWLRRQGFDGYVWPKDGDWHLSATPIGDKFLEGGPAANEYGDPKDGTPDAVRIRKNQTILQRFQQALPTLAPDVLEEFEEGLKGINLTRSIGHAIAPTAYVPDGYMEGLYKGLDPGRAMKLDFLRQADLASRSAEFDKRPGNDNLEFLKDFQLGRYRRGEVGDDPVLREHAEHMQDTQDAFFDATAAVMKKAGIPREINFLEDHMMNMWQEPDATDRIAAIQMQRNRVLTQMPAEGAADFLKRRYYETVEDGIAAGLTPVSTNPYVIQELQMMQTAKYMHAMGMFSESRQNGAVRLVPTVNQADFLRDHPDWEKMDQGMSKRYFPTQEGAFSAGDYFMEPNVARILKNYTGKDMLTQSNLGRTLAWAKNYSTAIELGFSPFHASVVTLEHFASSVGRAARSINTPGSSGLTELKNGVMDYLKAIQPRSVFGIDTGGSSTADVINNMSDDMRATAIRSGVTENMLPGVVPRTPTFASMKEALNNSQPLKAAAQAIPAVSEYLTRSLFQQVIPQLKLIGFQRELSISMLENADGLADGRIDPGSLVQMARRRMEDRFGQMGWDNLFWDKTMSGVLKLALRSTTWKLGSMGATAGAIGGLGARSGIIDAMRQASDALSKALIPEQPDPVQTAQAILGDKKPDPTLKNSRIGADVGWLLGTLTVNAMTAALYQAVMTGKSPGQTDAKTFDPELALNDLTSPRMGGLDTWGHDARANMPSYVREMRSATMAGKALAQGQIGKGSLYFSNSTSALFGRLMEGIANKDYYGNQIYDSNDVWTNKVAGAIQHMFTPPIAFQSAAQPGMTPLNAAAGMAGFTRASSRYQLTPFETWLSDAAAERYQGLPGKAPSEQPAQPPKPKTIQDRIKKASAYDLVMYGWDKMDPDEQQKYFSTIWTKAHEPHFIANLRQSPGRYAAFVKVRDQLGQQIRGTLSGSQ